jgi:hypothetical protein
MLDVSDSGGVNATCQSFFRVVGKF